MKNISMLSVLILSQAAFAQSTLSGRNQLQDFNREAATVSRSVSSAQFDDSVGVQGAFMAPDACPNLNGYQERVPDGYWLSEGQCVNTCVAPAASTQVVEESCPVGNTGRMFATVRTTYSCPSSTGQPVASSAIVAVNHNCAVSIRSAADLSGKWMNMFRFDSRHDQNYLVRIVSPTEIYLDMVWDTESYGSSFPYAAFISRPSAYRGQSSRYSCTETGQYINCYNGNANFFPSGWRNPGPGPYLRINKSTGSLEVGSSQRVLVNNGCRYYGDGMWYRAGDVSCEPQYTNQIIYTVRNPRTICQGDTDLAEPKTYGQLIPEDGQCPASGCSCTNNYTFPIKYY